MKHCGPDNGMKTQNILADCVDIRRMFFPALDSYRRNIVHERVSPHINNVAGMPWYGNAPIRFLAGEADVLQALLNEFFNLCKSIHGSNEARIFFVKFE